MDDNEISEYRLWGGPEALPLVEGQIRSLLKLIASTDEIKLLHIHIYANFTTVNLFGESTPKTSLASGSGPNMLQTTSCARRKLAWELDKASKPIGEVWVVKNARFNANTHGQVLSWFHTFSSWLFHIVHFPGREKKQIFQ
jgi:hypothetical protein